MSKDDIVSSQPSAERGRLADAISEAIQGGRHAAFSYRHISDMTPAAADAWRESTRNQFAIPAQEQTRQAEQKTLQVKEESKRHYASMSLIGAVAFGILVLLGINVWRGKEVDGKLLLLLLGLVLIAIGGPEVAKLARDWLGKSVPKLTGE